MAFYHTFFKNCKSSQNIHHSSEKSVKYSEKCWKCYDNENQWNFAKITNRPNAEKIFKPS